MVFYLINRLQRVSVPVLGLVGVCWLSPVDAHHAGAAKPLNATEVRAAWIQRAATEGWSLRAVVAEGRPCPQAMIEGQPRRMAERAPPLTGPSRPTDLGDVVKPSSLPGRVCELDLGAPSPRFDAIASEGRDFVQVGPFKLKSPIEEP